MFSEYPQKPTPVRDRGSCDIKKAQAKPRDSVRQDPPPTRDRSKEPETDEPFLIFSTTQKRLIVAIAALTTLLPPLTGSMYYPVIPTLARDLHVSVNHINYTITAYLILQGIAPSFMGNLSDESGRRPALTIAFLIHIAGCIGAAFRDNYVVLLVIRYVQSAGSSGTIAMSLATVSDIVTSAERGAYTIIGGLLSSNLGWKSIFWFLTIFASTVLAIFLTFMPETSRRIVGSGSIRNARWNKPLVRHLRKKTITSSVIAEGISKVKTSKKPRLSPWSSLKLFGDKETCCILLYGGVLYASSYVVVSTMLDQLQKLYGLTTIKTSLCYLAAGFGTVTSVLGPGQLLDWNFRRHAKRLGFEISKQRQQDLQEFPIEFARLQISFPVLIFAGGSLLAYGWTMQAQVHLAAPLVFLFLQAFGVARSFSGINNLLMDLNRDKPGTASAAMNLSRCWIGAGGMALSSLISDVGGPGWMTVTIVGVWVLLSPLIRMVSRYGQMWMARCRSSAT